jgi:hypothetical protein
MIQNTLLHRNALVLKFVNWLDFYTLYEKVPINRKNPFYNVYIYHGTKRSCGLQGVDLIIGANRT